MNKLYLKLIELGELTINVRATGYYINEPYRLSNDEFRELEDFASTFDIELKRTLYETVYNGRKIPPRISVYLKNRQPDTPIYFFNTFIEDRLNRQAESIEAIDYAEMMQAINNELRWISKSPKTITFNNGNKIDKGENIYEFDVTDAQYKQIKHVDECTVKYQEADYSGNITGKSNKKLKLFIKNKENLPENLDSVTLEWVASATYEFMKKRIMKNNNKVSDIQNLILFPVNKMIENNVQSLIYDNKETNRNQKHTIQQSFKNKVSYIWGPPGTGKTTTIMQIASNLINQGNRVLFVSNANRAVDLGVIELIDNLNKNFQDISIKKLITRYGAPFIENDDNLNEVFFDNQIKVKREELLIKINPTVEKRNKYKKLKHEINEIKETKENLDELKESIKRVQNAILMKKDEKNKYIQPENALVLAAKKIFNTELNEEKIKTIDKQLGKLEIRLERLNKELEVLKETGIISEIKSKLIEFSNLKTWIEQEFKGENELDNYIIKQTEVDKKEEIKSRKFIAATISKVITNNLLFEDTSYDTLIVDEASMIGVTPILVLAMLINKNIIIAGDPRQLPPITQNQTSDISKKWMGTDIFNIVGREENLMHWHQNNLNITFFLNQQYRMKPALGDFISQNFYEGELISEKTDIEEPYLFFADTTNNQIGRWEGERGLNVYNISHVEKIIELLNYIFTSGLTIEGTDTPLTDEHIGIITPINSAAKYIRQELDETKNYKNIEVGTIHTFQGREKEIIIFDTVMGGDLDFKIRPYDQTRTGHNVKKLLNVAFSRTKDKLFIVCDLNHFERQYTTPNGNQFIYNCLRNFKHISEIL